MNTSIIDRENESKYSNENNINFAVKALQSKIIQSVNDNLITFISSKTGSGKSTQVPQILYDYMINKEKKKEFSIICCEPRSIASDSISSFIKRKNRSIKIKNKIDDDYYNHSDQYLFFIKESDLLYLLKKDQYLKKCDILIIDEVHERTMKLDLILYYIKKLTLSKENRRKGFKLVFMSATFNTDNIHNYFSSIEDKNNITFGFINQNEENENFIDNNYDISYSDSISTSLSKGNSKFNDLNMGKILREISKIVRYEVYLNDYDKKTILIFLPDYKTIYKLYNMLNKEYRGYINLYQFSSALNIRQQNDIMYDLYGQKRAKYVICNVILATNLAETCLTFPNCDIVIDSGLRKNCKYNYDSNLYEEVIEYISQDSCIQRSGRCGRSQRRGKCYRLFSEDSFNSMDKYRKPEIEIGNIDLIILRLFDNLDIYKCSKNEIKQKGYLDFLSKIEKEKYNLIVEKLVKYNAVNTHKYIDYNYNSKTLLTDFGKWIKKTNMDIELGYYFNEFKKQYPEDIKKELVFQFLNIISTTDNYNNELFYSDIDPDWFKLNLLDNNKESYSKKTLIELSKNISKNIINQGLKKFFNSNNEIKKKNSTNEKGEEEEKVNLYYSNISHISPYYYLFSKLDDIYSGKNYYTKNKIFQLGDWIITLFFMNQYNLIKCLKHNYFKEYENENEDCETCKLVKYFYCSVYSLNEKYFINQKNRVRHIKNALFIEKDKDKENKFSISEKEESNIAKWNLIYLNLISKKPDAYINENQILKYINEFKSVDLEKELDKLYNEYKEIYIDIATKYLSITKNNDEMIIQRKIFIDDEEENENNINKESISPNNKNENNKIILYFNKNEKVNLMKSYFFEFIPHEIDKYFCLTKFRKIFGKENQGEKEIILSKLYYKVINPIFDEMIQKDYSIKNHLESLNKEVIDQKKIKVYNNIGKYFYFHFICPKLPKQNLEIYHNSIVNSFSKSDKDIDIEDKKISDLINIERNNYCNMLDFIQCLKGGCLTFQLTQGLEIKNIYDTYQNKNTNKNDLIYSIDCKKEDIQKIHQKIIDTKELDYEKLLIVNDNLLIVFRNSLRFSLFCEKQKLGLKLIPYDEKIQMTNEENDEIYYNKMKIFIVKFEQRYLTGEIHRIMKRYKSKLIEKYNYKINYFLDEGTEADTKTVYYYIISEDQINIPKKLILGVECNENLNQKIFSITSLSFTSDYDYFPNFRKYCQENNLNIVYKRQKLSNKKRYYNFTRKFELINYSIENMKLIQNYIGYTTISLNSFALMELKSKSKDTFLEYNESIFQYARNIHCNIRIIYYESKILIYGAPIYRKRLYEILSNYFSELQKEKIIYTLKGKEDNLLLKTICRKANQKQIVILTNKNDQGINQLEFRKKYFDIISKLLFKQKKGKKLNKIKSTRCEICLEKFDNENNNNYFKLKLCGHKFCIECLKMQICSSLQLASPNSIPIKCVKCNTIISNKDIFEIIIPNTQEYEFLINKLITIFMIKNSSDNLGKKYYWCPNKKENCNYIYSSQMKEIGQTNMTCPNCECKICLLCNDILDPDIPHNPDCQSKLYSKLNDKDRNWMLTNTKDCPICHTAYEKNKGCNHMTCNICRPPTHFCYICGHILNNDNPLSHFSDKESKCYNKLWDDESKNANDISANNSRIIDDNNEEDKKDESNYNNNDNDNDSRNYRNNINSYKNRSERNFISRRISHRDDLNMTNIMLKNVINNNSYRSEYYNYSKERNSNNYRGSNKMKRYHSDRKFYNRNFRKNK